MTTVESGDAPEGIATNDEPSYEAQLIAHEHEKRLHELHLRHRESLVSRSNSQFDTFHKAVMTISGGALAGSVTLLKDLVVRVPEPMVAVLRASWLTLILALVCSATATYLSAQSYRIELRDEDASYLRKEPVSYSVAARRFRKVHNIFEWASVLLLLTGLVALVYSLAAAPV